jgi:hypothetical protein
MKNENETPDAARGPVQDEPFHRQAHDFGEVQSRHGRINGWLLAVYLVMFLWALYYGWEYWGGLGPGLDLTLGG